MKEKIKELYDQAVSMASTELIEYNRSWKPDTRFEFDYEKVLYNMFAELIVKECARVDSEINNCDHIEGETYNQTILQHFGVE